jgi:GNAT superfamily N-acetyltransferase
MNFRLREATDQDYAGLCEVFAEVDALHAEALPHVFQPIDGPARTREYFASIIADPDAGLFVAESEGRIVGLVDVRIHETPPVPMLVPRRYAIIDAIAVRKGHQRKGVGRALMERAEQWAHDRGLSEVSLNVWEFNRGAIEFYERLGYATALRRMKRTIDK